MGRVKYPPRRAIPLRSDFDFPGPPPFAIRRRMALDYAAAFATCDDDSFRPITCRVELDSASRAITARLDLGETLCSGTADVGETAVDIAFEIVIQQAKACRGRSQGVTNWEISAAPMDAMSWKGMSNSDLDHGLLRGRAGSIQERFSKINGDRR